MRAAFEFPDFDMASDSWPSRTVGQARNRAGSGVLQWNGSDVDAAACCAVSDVIFYHRNRKIVAQFRFGRVASMKHGKARLKVQRHGDSFDVDIKFNQNGSNTCLDPGQNRQAEEKGILETQLGRDSVLARYRQAGGEARNFEVFLRDLRKEKPLAQKTVSRWGEWLTLAIENLADLFNPQLVVLAGPLSELFPFVEDEVKVRLRDRSFPTVESLEIEVSSFGKDSSALGGAALVYDQILSVPDSNFLEDLDLNEAAIE